MIKLRPWKETKNEFEVDIIVNGPSGRTLRKRVKAPVTGRSNAERWAKSVEQDLLTQLLAPEPEPEKPPAPTFEEFAVIFLDLCKANRLGVNTLMNYEIHLRLYLLPVLGKRRLDAMVPADITAIKTSLATKARNTMCEVLKSLAGARAAIGLIEVGVVAFFVRSVDDAVAAHRYVAGRRRAGGTACQAAQSRSSPQPATITHAATTNLELAMPPRLISLPGKPQAQAYV